MNPSTLFFLGPALTLQSPARRRCSRNEAMTTAVTLPHHRETLRHDPVGG